MSTDVTPVTKPDFDYTVLGDPDTPHPVDAIVTDALCELRWGIDGFFDTVEKYREQELSKSAFTDGCEIATKQIQEARELLAGCGVTLPNAGVNFDTTTQRERLHELGRWAYQFFCDTYPW